MVYPEKTTDLAGTSTWARFELTILVVIGTDYTGSCKSNYHTITTTAVPILYRRTIYASCRRRLFTWNLCNSKKSNYNIHVHTSSSIIKYTCTSFGNREKSEPLSYFVCVCMFAYSDVQHFVLTYVFTFWVPCCDVRYDFRIKTMFGSSLPPVVCVKVDVLFTLFCLFTYSGDQHILTLWVTWRVSY